MREGVWLGEILKKLNTKRGNGKEWPMFTFSKGLGDNLPKEKRVFARS